MFRISTTRSIAFRLVAAVLAVELVSSIAVILLSLGYERHTHFMAFDVMLRGRADSLLVAVQDSEDAQASVFLNPAELHIPPADIYEVWDQNGRLLGRSANWQGSETASAQSDHGGYLRLIVNGQHYRALRMHASRFVDAGEPGGRKLRPVLIIYGAPTVHVWHAIRRAVEFYAGGSLLLLVVTGPLIAWLLHRGLLPLRQIAAQASGVSVHNWTFNPPPNARATPELASITQAIESVLQRLERSFQQQRTFVSDAAHELKTAVAVVKSSLQLLGMKHRSAAEYQAGIERCLADTQRMEETVAGMLALARLEAPHEGPGGAPLACDLHECIEQTAAKLAAVAEVRGIQVSVSAEDPADGSLWAAIAPEDASMLVSNLLHNALQHSPAGSQIAVRLSQASAFVTLEIEDHGDGIDSEALPHVFDRFYRGDPSRARSTGGTGLGLSICKAAVDRAGGTISLASQPGQGTTVTVVLPRANAPAPEPGSGFSGN